ncbi:hypothetical protein GGF46_003626 [Coemansia sp. RSA 552]|nr:hypothetical protein GGF46_003626 [Coemansia sp. RSA 552]
MELYIPAKRRLAANDPFFALGNAEANTRHVVRIRDVHVDGIVDCLAKDTGRLQRPMRCHEPPCCGSHQFPSALAFEKHYDQVHRYRCATCGAMLPSEHWLDLHIQETHDGFFRAQVERGEKLFQCFLPTCTRTFSRPHKRNMHMVDKHGFARSFNWGLVRTGLRPAAGKITARRTQRASAPRADLMAPRADPAADDAPNQLAENQEGAENMDVDQLTSAFQRSLSIGVPRSVSFGRRGGGGGGDGGARGRRR